MIADLNPQSARLRPAMHRLMARHGATAVLFAAIRTALLPRRRRPRPPDPYMLSPHLRRDIGLPPAGPQVTRYYELR